MSRAYRTNPITTLVLGAAVAFIAALMALPASAQDATGSAQQPASTTSANPCGEGLFELKPGSGLCTHGHDPAPAGVDPSDEVEPVKPSAVAARGFVAAGPNYTCDGDGVSGPRFQLGYVVSADDPDRYDQYEESIKFWGQTVSDMMNASARKTGGERRIRFVHDASCAPTVIKAILPARSTDDPLDTIFGFFHTPHYDKTLGRNFALFVDGTGSGPSCGLATSSRDDQPGFENAANRGNLLALVYSGCWSADMMAH